MPKSSRIYWDTCAWLGLLNGEPDKRRELEIVYENARRNKYEIWTSAIAIAETRRLRSEKDDPKLLPKEAEQKIRDIFRQPFVKVVPLTQLISEEARSIWRLTSGLGKWQDAIHLASAMAWNVTVFHTYDGDDLLHLSSKFMTKSGDLIVICYPDETTDGPLFKKG